MEEFNNPSPLITAYQPWNKGKLIGAKPPLRSKHVWSIRTKLQIEGRKRDLALPLGKRKLVTRFALKSRNRQGKRSMNI